MPSKTEFYRKMADHVATQLTGSWQEWAGFLTTAARLYKYRPCVLCGLRFQNEKSGGAIHL